MKDLFRYQNKRPAAGGDNRKPKAGIRKGTTEQRMRLRPQNRFRRTDRRPGDAASPADHGSGTRFDRRWLAHGTQRARHGGAPHRVPRSAAPSAPATYQRAPAGGEEAGPGGIDTRVAYPPESRIGAGVPDAALARSIRGASRASLGSRRAIDRPIASAVEPLGDVTVNNGKFRGCRRHFAVEHHSVDVHFGIFLYIVQSLKSAKTFRPGAVEHRF